MLLIGLNFNFAFIRKKILSKFNNREVFAFCKHDLFEHLDEEDSLFLISFFIFLVEVRLNQTFSVNEDDILRPLRLTLNHLRQQLLLH